MATDLITYLNEELNQWEILAADMEHEIVNTERPELREYYVCMMLELQVTREALVAALVSALADHVADNYFPSYSMN